MEPQKQKSPSSFWLRVKSLKQAASNVSSKVNYLSSAESSDDHSDASSVGGELTPNRCVNESISFQGLSYKNQENKAREVQSLCIDSTDSTSVLDDLSYFQKSLDKRNAYIKKLRKKYSKDINKLQAENERLREALENSHSENFGLQDEIKTMQREHAFQLQAMQANHERRLKKAKGEWEIIISEMNAQTAAMVAERLSKQNREEIEQIKDEYEQLIDELRIEYEMEIQRIENQISSPCPHNKETLSLDFMMSPDKLDRPKEMLEDTGPRCSLFKEGQMNESIRNEMQDTISCMEAKIFKQAEIIQQQDRVIDNLSLELQTAFKKKKGNRSRSLATNTSFDKTKDMILQEGNLVALISQIK
jgi:hypothetical protein